MVRIRKFRKNAFTLIELLAVIVILAIIALIAVPVIMNIINKANKSAFKDTAYGIINAGELYFAEQQLEPMGMSKDETITLPDTTKKLELKGEIPEGTITITKEGKISLLIKNNRYCVTKGLDDNDVTITEDVANCKISNGDNTGGENTPENSLVTDITLNTTSVSIINGETYKLEVTIEPESATNQDLTFISSNTSVATIDENGLITGITGGTTVITVATTDGSNISKEINVIVTKPADPNSLTSLATTTTEVTSVPHCITNNTTCVEGTPVAIKVNNTETYNFYVISETEDKVTLIMDRNLGDNVAWDAAIHILYGPKKAVPALKERTSGWTNIPEKEYTYSDDGGGNKYTVFKETMRARMLKYTEATTLGCTESLGNCPRWLYINLTGTGSDTDNSGNVRRGYWLSAAWGGNNYNAHAISYTGKVNYTMPDNSNYGIRPVIELLK